MSFSKPELEQQAKELTNQILDELGKIGISSQKKNTGGIMIPGHYEEICRVSEGAGELVVSFGSIYLGGIGPLCYAKKFKASTKNLVPKVVESIKERRDAIIAQKSRNADEDKANLSHAETLKHMRENYPEFSRNIQYHAREINLSFNLLTEDKARLILNTLRDAGISGDK
jgi:hypothetical protein